MSLQVSRQLLFSDNPAFFSVGLKWWAFMLSALNGLGRTNIRRNFNQMEEAFSCILGNLYHTDIVDEPLIYSRNSSRYIIERQRYGYEFYTYKMFTPQSFALTIRKPKRLPNKT